MGSNDEKKKKIFNSSQDYLKNVKQDCKKRGDANSQKNICCIPSTYNNKHAYMNNRVLDNNQIEALRKYESRWKRNTDECCDNKLTYSSSYVKRDKYELFNKQLYNIQNQNLNTTNEGLKKMVKMKMTKSDYMHTLKFPRTK
jgi:hypothetical protein